VVLNRQESVQGSGAFERFAGLRGAAPEPENQAPSMRILIVEDDPRIHKPLADDLRRQRHSVDVAEDGVSGLNFASTQIHDVILLDILLPGIDGLEICRRLRAERSNAFIMMITALQGTTSKVDALDTGADDYIVKPFDLAEVSARIRAVSRRARVPQEPVLAHGDLRLDPSRGLVTCNGKPVPLTRTEYVILETLMRSPMQVFGRAMLRNKFTTFENDSEHDSIKTHITNIRRKVRAVGGSSDPIQSVYGVGYRLSDIRA
jgi:two-component system, OmpR family, response regulator QseB